MHSATSSTAPVASTYASQVPFPARAHTRGMVATGVVVGAMVETDCASVSIGERTAFRRRECVSGGGVSSIKSPFALAEYCGQRYRRWWGDARVRPTMSDSNSGFGVAKV